MSGPYKMKGSPMARNYGAPFRHAPYAAAHTKAEGKVAHPATAEAHGKKTEDFYDGSRGKPVDTKNYSDTSGTKKPRNSSDASDTEKPKKT